MLRLSGPRCIQYHECSFFFEKKPNIKNYILYTSTFSVIFIPYNGDGLNLKNACEKSRISFRSCMLGIQIRNSKMDLNIVELTKGAEIFTDHNTLIRF